jgi:hypothetical protein
VVGNPVVAVHQLFFAEYFIFSAAPLPRLKKLKEALAIALMYAHHYHPACTFVIKIQEAGGLIISLTSR